MNDSLSLKDRNFPQMAENRKMYLLTNTLFRNETESVRYNTVSQSRLTHLA